MKEGEHIIIAAGGNATAIRVIGMAKDRAWYEREGVDLLERATKHDAEQSGFLILEDGHFEMAGGEFCGNAARSAAVLLFVIFGESNFTFTMSGYNGQVRAVVRPEEDRPGRYDVSCTFAELPTDKTVVIVLDSQNATLVDLGGIVHVVIEAPFPENYEAQHRQITRELGLQDRGAVGVCWIRGDGEAVHMDPVVWVRAIDSFFYETSCGSGSIAVEAVTGANRIGQPSGKTIDVRRDDRGITLHSEMEVANVG